MLPFNKNLKEKARKLRRNMTLAEKKIWYQILVGAKFLCVVVKNLVVDFFIITAYFTDKKKKGESKWTKE